VRVAAGAGPPRVDPPAQGGPRFAPHPGVLVLAERITRGLSSDADRARAIETYLQSSFSYSMAGMGRIGPDPIAWFLLESRAGHCEYFAGGMVVLLDALGVPARMVGGYSGGSSSPEGDELVVREANAHAWVEVWLGPERGWKNFDPTPIANVPGVSVERMGDRVRFAWEWLQSSWDRYVLTFGMAEQMDLLTFWASGLRRRCSATGAGCLVIVLLAAAVAASGGSEGMAARPVARAAARTPAARAIARLVRRLERGGAGAGPRPSAGSAAARPRAGREAAAEIAELERLAERSSTPPGPHRTARRVRRAWSALRPRHRSSRDR
jgi:hypothetical protein